MGFLFELLGVPELIEHRVSGDDRTVIQVLLDAGTDINAREQPGSYRADDGGWRGWISNVVAALLVAGADRDLRDDEGRTALEYATRGDLGRHSVPCPPAINCHARLESLSSWRLAA